MEICPNTVSRFSCAAGLTCYYRLCAEWASTVDTAFCMAIFKAAGDGATCRYGCRVLSTALNNRKRVGFVLWRNRACMIPLVELRYHERGSAIVFAPHDKGLVILCETSFGDSIAPYRDILPSCFHNQTAKQPPTGLTMLWRTGCQVVLLSIQYHWRTWTIPDVWARNVGGLNGRRGTAPQLSHSNRNFTNLSTINSNTTTE
jgi:hypothetical protein